MPTDSVILFIGSSSIRLWDLDQHFPNYYGLNRGITVRTYTMRDD